MVDKPIHLIVAGDIPDLISMPDQLTRQGFNVHVCKDGPETLQLALTKSPQLIVLSLDLPLLPAVRLVKILRSNPKTLEIPFFVIGPEEQQKEALTFLRPGKDAFVSFPFNQEQMISRIGQMVKKSSHVGDLSGGKSEIEGSLNQISLVDLLQIFNLNRKDGVLTLKSREEKGTVYLLEGNIVNAQIGPVDGEKAFFRLLGWDQGSFWFSPGGVDCEIRINSPTDHLIMEGLRQKDEMESQLRLLPRPDMALKLRVPRDRLPKGLRPVTEQILTLLHHYEKVEDVLNKCPRSDYEILHILQVLLDKGLIKEARNAETVAKRDERPLLVAEEIVAIRDCLGERDSLLEEGSAKLIVLASSSRELNDFIEVFKGIREMELEVGWKNTETIFRLGDFGRLRVSENFFLRLFSLSSAPESTPLWAPFCRRVVGVLSLRPYEEKTAAEAFFRDNKIPLFRVRLDKPQEDEICLYPGDRFGLRKLLATCTTAFLTNHAVMRNFQ